MHYDYDLVIMWSVNSDCIYATPCGSFSHVSIQSLGVIISIVMQSGIDPLLLDPILLLYFKLETFFTFSNVTFVYPDGAWIAFFVFVFHLMNRASFLSISPSRLGILNFPIPWSCGHNPGGEQKTWTYLLPCSCDALLVLASVRSVGLLSGCKIVRLLHSKV